MSRCRTLIVAALGGLSACFGRGEPTTPGEIPPPPPPPAITISMGPADAALAVGKTLQFQATANIVAAGWVWSSQNGAIAVVGPDGLVLGVGPGSVRIQACPANASSFCGLVDLTVVAAPESGAPEVSVAPGTYTLAVGQSLEYMATALNFSEPDWAWYSMDPATATVSAAGVVTGRRPGTAVVAACAPAPLRYCGTAVVQVR